ncbi:MAG TPA: ThiF family adenylyltransferase [Daejeonella sp.]|nr:ThiF family adenylyltransferase [Daejeonella sp.]
MKQLLGEIVNDAFEPLFYRLQIEEDRKNYEELINSKQPIKVFDQIESQLRELINCLNPSKNITGDQITAFIDAHLDGCPRDEYGVWIYYPWTQGLVHVLDEAEFIEVRTNRNRNKITQAEQEILKTKAIGVVGLSVGQSIALTIAMERVCGEIRLADFDTADLSNLNRLRTGLHNLGLKKTIVAAREIAEIDPFIKVVIYNEGLTTDNMDDFFLQGGKLDLLVEVCDGLETKVSSRIRARELLIPVVMDTNDRGMLDIERFDLEPTRPILHGLVGDLRPEDIGGLSNREKIPLILKIVGADTISDRLRASMSELGKTLKNLPQLASSVVLGGAITTDAVRRILLNQFPHSGRYYIDTDLLISDELNTQTTLRKQPQESLSENL